METASGPSRNSRAYRRYRKRTQLAVPADEFATTKVKEEEPRPADVDEPLLEREQRGRTVMGEAHRKFHRRVADQVPKILTVNVNVEQTIDTVGNVVGVATVTPVLPVVPTVPTNGVPTVPAVPAFPSDLNVPTVPAYPYPSGTATAMATPTVPTTTPTPTLTSIVTDASSTLPSTYSGFNSTSSSIISSSSSSSSSLNSTSLLSTSSSTRSSTLSSSSRRTTTSSSTSSSSTTSVYVSQTSSAGGGGGGFIPQSTVAPAEPTETAAIAEAQSNSPTPLGTPQVVGTVFGSLAGAALLLALLLFLIRRHKQKQRGALQLTGDGDTDQHQPMAQTAARSSFVAPSFLNRFSGASRSTAESSGTGERSFQRVSGRKLPSAFSEGMTSEQFARNQGTLSGSSFYTDDKGFYGGAGVMSKDFGKEVGEVSNTGTVGKDERVMPSPARTPVIHHPEDAPPWGTSRNGGSTLSPPQSPNNPFADPVHIPRGTLGRSHPSHDGSRSSRFTENV